MTRKRPAIGRPREGDHDEILEILEAICRNAPPGRSAIVANALAHNCTEETAHLRRIACPRRASPRRPSHRPA